MVRERARGAGAGRDIEVEEDGGDDGRIGEEREDPHLAAREDSWNEVDQVLRERAGDSMSTLTIGIAG